MSVLPVVAAPHRATALIRAACTVGRSHEYPRRPAGKGVLVPVRRMIRSALRRWNPGEPVVVVTYLGYVAQPESGPVAY